MLAVVGVYAILVHVAAEESGRGAVGSRIETILLSQDSSHMT